MAAVGSVFARLSRTAVHMKTQAAGGNLAGSAVKLHLDVSRSIAKPQDVLQLRRLFGDYTDNGAVGYLGLQRGCVWTDEKFRPDRVGAFLAVDEIAKMEVVFFMAGLF